MSTVSYMHASGSFASYTTTKSVSSSRSAAPLISGTSSKDYSSALADLQSTYGFGGSVPSVPSSSKKQAKRTSPSQSKSAHKVAHVVFPSSASPEAQEKDYSSAFGQLQSQYGLGGGAPLPRVAHTSMKSKSSKEAPLSTIPTQSGSDAKDYERAFGQLSSSYGLSGGVPAIEQKTKSSKRSFLSGLLSI